MLDQPQDLNQPSVLIGLPAELWSMSFEYLRKKDLMTVRKTHNRQLCDLAKSSFAKVLPPVWRFVFTEESLRALQRFTVDQVYAVRCKSISFGTYRIDTVTAPRRPPAVGTDLRRKKVDSPPENKVMTAAKHTAAMEVYQEKLEKFDEHDKILQRQEKFLRTGSHTALIIGALLNLQAIGKTDVILGVHDGNNITSHTHTKNLGFAAKESYTKALKQIREVSETLTAIRSAVDVSRYPLKSLRFELSQKLPSINDLHWKKPHSTPDLYIGLSRAPAVSISSHHNCLEIANQSLMNVSGANFYSLFVDDYQNGIEDLDTAFRTIKLKHILGPYKNIENLLSRDATQCLKLRHCHLYKSKATYGQNGLASLYTAVEFCRFLKAMPHLEDLVLQSIRDGPRRYLQQARVHWKGQAEIHAGLENLIAMLRGRN